jgi:hypothetical protein
VTHTGLDFDAQFGRDDEYYGLAPSPHLVSCEGYLREGAALGVAVDVGSGQGRDGRWLSTIGMRVISLDVSEPGLRVARSAGLVVCRGSGVALPLRDSSVAVVNATTVIDHLPASLAEDAIFEFRRVLTAGGLLAVEVFTIEDPGCTGRGEVSETAGMVTRYFGRGELRGMFADLDLLYYSEGVEPDWSHGPRHSHGVARLVARVLSAKQPVKSAR